VERPAGRGVEQVGGAVGPLDVQQRAAGLELVADGVQGPARAASRSRCRSAAAARRSPSGS
jgi:hypothetical protein